MNRLQKNEVKEVGPQAENKERSYRVSYRREGKGKCGQQEEITMCFPKPIFTLPPFYHCSCYSSAPVASVDLWRCLWKPAGPGTSPVLRQAS